MSGDGFNRTLPYASTLCGACYDACPVKINIPRCSSPATVRGGR